VNEAFIEVFQVDLARKRFHCRRIYLLHRNVFNGINFLPSQLMEISKPDVKTAQSEDGVTDIHIASISSGQQPPGSPEENIITS